MGEGIVREFGMDMDTLPYWKWITNEDLVYSTGNSAQCCVAPSVQHRELCSMLCCSLDGRESGGEWIHVLNSFTVHLKLSQHCLLTGYIPIQNKKLRKTSFQKTWRHLTLLRHWQSSIEWCCPLPNWAGNSLVSITAVLMRLGEPASDGICPLRSVRTL